MHVLFTTRPLMGHYNPMRPLMDALTSAGDEVAVATGEPIVGKAVDDGFAVYRVGMDNDDPAIARQRAILRTLPPDDLRRFAFTEWFVRTEMPARIDGLEDAVHRFRPDLIVHETAEFAAPLVASARGIPYATHGYGPLLRPDAAALAGAAAAPYWQDRGLEPHPLGGLYQHLYLDICPPSLQIPAIADIERVQLVGPARNRDAPADLPWLNDLAGRPIVYVTLGTVFNQDSKVFMTLLDGVRDQHVNVVVTVGSDNHPSALGPQPPHVHVHRFIYQQLLLPHCSMAVTHGGAGSTFGALSFGVPLIMAPQSADQFYNAERVLAAGAGIALMPGELTADSVRTAARAVLNEPNYREAAERIKEEFDRMPELAAVRGVLERLAERG